MLLLSIGTGLEKGLITTKDSLNTAQIPHVEAAEPPALPAAANRRSCRIFRSCSLTPLNFIYQSINCSQSPASGPPWQTSFTSGKNSERYEVTFIWSWIGVSDVSVL